MFIAKSLIGSSDSFDIPTTQNVAYNLSVFVLERYSYTMCKNENWVELNFDGLGEDGVVVCAVTAVELLLML